MFNPAPSSVLYWGLVLNVFKGIRNKGAGK